MVSDLAGDFFFTYGQYQTLLTSTDQGGSWTSANSPLHFELPSPLFGWTPGDMSLQLSNNGPVYMGPSLVGCDRPLVSADPNTGTVYATCSDHGDQSGGEGDSTWPALFLVCRASLLESLVSPDCGRRYVSASYDHGNTWTSWQPLDSASYPQADTGGFDGIPAAAHGVLATAYIAGSAPGSDCSICVVFETSTDAGATGQRHLVPGVTPEIGNQNNQTEWYEPYIAADPVHAGHYAIMVVDPTGTEMSVFETQDSGASWSGPTVLRNGSDQVNKPAMAFGPSGALGIFWKSVHQDLSFDVLAAVSPSGNLDFGRPVQLSEQSSQEETCGNFPPYAVGCDDMSSMVMDASNLDATWGANVGGQQNPWFGRYNFGDDPQFRGLSQGH